MLLPFQILGLWFRGLLAVAILAGGAYLLKRWYDHRDLVVHRQVDNEPVRAPDPFAEPPDTKVEVVETVPWRFGMNKETAWLLGGAALLLWSIGGSFTWTSLLRRSSEGPPVTIRGKGEVRKIQRPDGTELHVELHGPQGGAPIVLTHGWGLDIDEWVYATKLAERHRLIVWDLPGLGESKSPNTKDWSLEKLANDLDAVIDLAGGRPAFLVGHSIGGMITLTYCKLFARDVVRRVAGIVIVHSTYTNPCRTTKHSGLYTALQKPVLEPLCWLMIVLAPVFWLMNWMSYINGSAHRSTSRTSFSGKESRQQLGFMTRYYVWAWPSVLARGFLGMFRYDATDALSTIKTPSLIVAADGDEMCLPEASEHMAQAIPSAQLVTIPDARHCGLFEHHERFAEVVDEFVRRHST